MERRTRFTTTSIARDRATQPPKSYALSVAGTTLEISKRGLYLRRFPRRRPGHRLDGNRGHGRAVVEVDVLHRVVRVVVALAVDVVVLHEEHHRHAGVGKNLPVGVVER